MEEEERCKEEEEEARAPVATKGIEGEMLQ